MIHLKDYINNDVRISEARLRDYNGEVKRQMYHPTTVDELQKLIRILLEERGLDADLNDIDTSGMTDMSHLFYNARKNGFAPNISQWDVSNVRDMSEMFRDSNFNGDISNWDVRKVKNMSHMFEDSSFNGDIKKWDVSSVKDMSYMFAHSAFARNLRRWNVQPDTNMHDMFRSSQVYPRPQWYHA